MANSQDIAELLEKGERLAKERAANESERSAVAMSLIMQVGNNLYRSRKSH